MRISPSFFNSVRLLEYYQHEISSSWETIFLYCYTSLIENVDQLINLQMISFTGITNPQLIWETDAHLQKNLYYEK